MEISFCCAFILSMLFVVVEFVLYFRILASTMEPLKESGRLLEEAGACIMRRQSVAEVGQCFLDCSDNLSLLASAIEPVALESSQRMTFAAKRMKDAGQSLKPSSASENETKPKGKAWLQG